MYVATTRNQPRSLAFPIPGLRNIRVELFRLILLSSIADYRSRGASTMKVVFSRGDAIQVAVVRRLSGERRVQIGAEL